MNVKALQCPKCGGPIPVTVGVLAIACCYCGSNLRVTRGASGEPVAVLSEIAHGTRLLAKKQALEYLNGRLDELAARVWSLVQALRPNSFQRTAWVELRESYKDEFRLIDERDELVLTDGSLALLPTHGLFWTGMKWTGVDPDTKERFRSIVVQIKATRAKIAQLKQELDALSADV